MIRLTGSIFLILALLASLIMIRPGLIHFSRLKTEWPPWQPTSVELIHKIPRISSMHFRDRLIATWREPETFSYYRLSPERANIAPDPIPLNLAISWRFANLNIGIHGASKATPAVDDSGIYVGGDSGWFYSFAHDGKLRWKFHIADATRGIHSTAILSRNRVYIGGYNGTFYCLNKENGQVIWSMNSFASGYGSSPLVVGHSLIAAIETSDLRDGFIANIDVRDGHLLWQSQALSEQIHSSPTYSAKTGLIYVGANNGYLFALHMHDGTIAWYMNLKGAIKGTPLLTENGVLVTTWDKTIVCMAPDTGKIKWKTQLEGRSQSSPTLVPGTTTAVVGDSDGWIYGIDVNSGQIKWRKHTEIGIISSALTAKDPRSGKWVAWIACSAEKLCAFEPYTGQVLAEIAIPARLTGQPAAFHSDLYLGLNYPGGLVKLSPAP